ncbi:MAG: nucleotidyltransferase [Eubacteriales bacterium]|nr:nucleotidyltransferase [Eubacteriales bacterium]MDD4390154.1 nucleotidyltransferase [Eubacteriales bacterium]
MNILGIIAEYNPFHNGHLYHLEKSKRKTCADMAVVIMSGSFVQRGEPAFADKWTRAEIAIKNGADLVLELPFAFACNNAEYFAKGSVQMLDRLGCVDYISFGSEMGEIEPLIKAAHIVADESNEFKSIMRYKLDNGMPYPKAAAQTLSEFSGLSENELSSPNNLLSIQYIKHLIKRKSNIKIATVSRDGITSASQVRAMIKAGDQISDLVPAQTIEVLEKLNYGVNLEINNFFDQIYSSLLRTDRASLSEIFAANEGLENRILDNIRNTQNIDVLINLVKGKRYTTSRIKRLLVQQIVGLTKSNFEEIIREELMYGRVLALSAKGGELLRHIKKKELCDFPIITNINKERESLGVSEILLNMDILAADLYNLAAKRNLYDYSDFVMRPFVQKS